MTLFSGRSTRRKGALALVGLMAMLAVVFNPAQDQKAAATGNATMALSPAASTAPLFPATFSVTVTQNADVDTSQAQVTLNFDRTVFEVVDVARGAAYTGAGSSQSVGKSVAAGAPTFPNGFGASETGCGAGESVDSDGDGFINDGCSARGAAEVACAGSTDDDGDGRANDGCPMVGALAEVNQCSNATNDDTTDADAFINDGCAAAGTGEVGYQCKPLDASPANTVDDDADGRLNDGCPRVGGAESEADCNGSVDNDADGFINDGCPVNGGSESGAPQCGADTTDNDGDGRVNDGCPQIGSAASESGAACADGSPGVDDDGDGLVNDGCPVVAFLESGTLCFNATDDDGDSRSNDGCPANNPSEINMCGNALDEDGDGSTNDGCPAQGAAEGACGGTADDDADGVVNDGCAAVAAAEVDNCSNATDNDGDGSVNDGCPRKGGGETGVQCSNSSDDDSDTIVNDGCRQIGGNEQDIPCQDATDSEPDGVVNDGCAAVNVISEQEFAGGCVNALDDDGDDFVNDGCAATSTAETGPPCTDTLDNDSDGLFNDACALFAPAESGGACADAIDDPADADESINDGCARSGANSEVQNCTNTTNDDPADAGDTAVNDGCSAFGPAESGGECLDSIDQDADTFINDGCPRTGAAEAAIDCNNGVDNDGDKQVDDGCPETGAQCTGANQGVDNDGDLVLDDGCFPPNESGGACDNWLDDDADGLINDGCTATELAAIEEANTVDGSLDKAAVYWEPGVVVSPGPADAIVFTLRAKPGVSCGGSLLTLTDTAMGDSTGDPVTISTVAGGYVSVTGSDNDFPGGSFGGTQAWIDDSRTVAEALRKGADACDINDDNDLSCTDAEELGANINLGGTRNPLNPWDFADVPAPALPAAGVRNGAITLTDVGAALAWVGRTNNGPPGPGPDFKDYDDDDNVNGVEDGAEYDRIPAGAISGPPNGAISLQDVGVILNQVGDSCVAAPN